VREVSRALLCVSVAFAVAGGGGCKKKVTEVECASLVDRYARFVVTEKFPDASAATVEAEQERERREAQGDENFRNCTAEVSAREYDCAMRASSANAIEKCLE
jgi:hypothetical protein